MHNLQCSWGMINCVSGSVIIFFPRIFAMISKKVRKLMWQARDQSLMICLYLYTTIVVIGQSDLRMTDKNWTEHALSFITV